MEKEKYIKITNTNVLPYVGISHNPSIKRKFLLNLNSNLRYLDLMIPCEIKDKAVISLNVELGQKHVNEEEKELFEAEFIKQKTSA